MGALVSFFAGIVSTISSIISSILSTIVSSISSVITTVASKIAAITKAIVATVANVARAIGNVIVSGIDKIVSAAGRIGSTVWNTLKNFSSAVYNTLRSDAWQLAQDCYARARQLLRAGYKATAQVMGKLGDLASSILNSIADMASGMVDMVKRIAGGLWDFVREGFKGIRAAIGGIWDFINNVIVKKLDTLWGYYEDMKKGIMGKLKRLFDFYDKYIKNYVDKIAWIIHKTSEISKIIGYFKAGKVKEGILAGIALMNEKVGKEIAKVLDGISKMIKDPFQAVGALVGHVLEKIEHLNDRLRMVIGDLQEIAKNIGVKELRSVAEAIEAVRKKTLVYVDERLRDIRKEMRQISTMLTRELSETSIFIRQTMYDYHKYDYLIRFSDLRKVGATRFRPYFPIIPLWGI